MSEATKKEELMKDQPFTGTCSVCDRKDVPVRHFEVCAATCETITICTRCQPSPKPRGGNPAAVAVALADAGFRGPITQRCLSMLTRWKDRGLRWVVEQVLDDTGLTVVPTTDAATSPRWLLTLFDLLRSEPLVCTWCGAGDELLYFGGPTVEQVTAICDRCHLARSLKDTHCCLRCGSGSDDLIFLPIDGSEFGIYLCQTCGG